MELINFQRRFSTNGKNFIIKYDNLCLFHLKCFNSLLAIVPIFYRCLSGKTNLFIENWYVFIIFSLIKVSSNQFQIIFADEIASGCQSTAHSRIIRNERFIRANFSLRLFEKFNFIISKKTILRELPIAKLWWRISSRANKSQSQQTFTNKLSLLLSSKVPNKQSENIWNMSIKKMK